MGTVARITFATPDCSKARSGNAVEVSARGPLAFVTLDVLFA